MDKGLKFFMEAVKPHLIVDIPKTNEQKREELEDRYSNKLFDMTDEELDTEYQEKVG